MRTLRLRGLAAVLALLVLGAGACGSDDEDASTDTTAAAEADAAEEAGEGCVAPEAGSGGPEAPEVEVPTDSVPDELVTNDLIVGEGAEAALGDDITVNYVGVSCSTGEVFDSSWARGEPATFPLVEGGLIAGWTEGIPGMAEGGRRSLVIPSELGYGETGNQGIAPNETLIFVVDLVAIVPKG